MLVTFLWCQAQSVRFISQFAHVVVFVLGRISGSVVTAASAEWLAILKKPLPNWVRRISGNIRYSLRFRTASSMATLCVCCWSCSDGRREIKLLRSDTEHVHTLYQRRSHWRPTGVLPFSASIEMNSGILNPSQRLTSDQHPWCLPGGMQADHVCAALGTIQCSTLVPEIRAQFQLRTPLDRNQGFSMLALAQGLCWHSPKGYAGAHFTDSSDLIAPKFYQPPKSGAI